MIGPTPETITTTPSDWNDGSSATFEPWSDGHGVGFRCTVNGKVSFIYLNPSTGGGSPDVFVYQGETGDPFHDSPVCFLTPDGVPTEPEK